MTPLRPERPLVDAVGGLVLRPWRSEDAPVLARAWGTPDIAGDERTPDDAVAWIEGFRARRSVDLAVVGLDDDVVRGEVGLVPLRLQAGSRAREEVEIGWWTLPEHRGRGVASAAARRLVSWAVTDGGLVRVVARIGRGHVASEAVARHAGLARLGPAGGDRDLWAGPDAAAARV